MSHTDCGVTGGPIKDGVYRPIIDWTMVPGARVSEERVKQLMAFDFESAWDLSVDDIIACNNRKFQAVQWSFADAALKVVGEEKTNELYYEIGRTAGKAGWQAIINHFGTKKLTPAQVAWYQDMAHFFYGPHTHAYTEYNEDTVVVTRQDCGISFPPRGMEDKNKYLDPFGDGYIGAYRELAPYLEITLQQFIKPEDMKYKVDLSKYPSFGEGYKRAGDPIGQIIFKWIE